MSLQIPRPLHIRQRLPNHTFYQGQGYYGAKYTETSHFYDAFAPNDMGLAQPRTLSSRVRWYNITYKDSLSKHFFDIFQNNA